MPRTPVRIAINGVPSRAGVGGVSPTKHRLLRIRTNHVHEVIVPHTRARTHAGSCWPPLRPKPGGCDSRCTSMTTLYAGSSPSKARPENESHLCVVRPESQNISWPVLQPRGRWLFSSPLSRLFADT
ncbi:hypothetical protein GQ53DRAFT_263103 [Thozetella sp. PMI_491]|nr:hypothetical protein GQ53DRAFT_263103 [Thozetella sp. PMI_491]